MQFKKLLHSKGNHHQNKKATYEMVEKIFANCLSGKGLTRKIHNPIKYAKVVNRHFSKDIPIDQQVLSITNFQENVNQNHSITSTC